MSAGMVLGIDMTVGMAVGMDGDGMMRDDGMLDGCLLEEDGMGDVVRRGNGSVEDCMAE